MEKLKIKFKSYDHRSLDQSVSKIVKSLESNGVQVFGPIPLPTKTKKITILRSTHVHKNSREQFETRTYSRLVEIINFNPNIIDKLRSTKLSSDIKVDIKI
ncbi:30S ribosomal protein S10 [Mycoplasma sp. SG1]|uniref:30S ribosomal protein S10 n=1 Tax=Mycoplasma sp. SG1 TaxID=2810348 RepID=UPI0020249CFC|nr:30S ribosomal protein S10 [Mycoplasma sp. SG1]URM52890.1 30S ribosomal protein S10 [Mycoplasma sp. SG1]